MGSQETIVCALALLRPPVLQTLSPSGGSSRPCSLAFLKSRGAYRAASHLPGGWAGGCAWTVLKYQEGSWSIAAAWNCHVCLRPEEAVIAASCSSCVIAAKPEAEEIPPQASPCSQPPFSQKLSFGIKFTRADEVCRTCPCLMLRSCHIAGEAAGPGAPAVLEVAAESPHLPSVG